jgi:hypothetical protein
MVPMPFLLSNNNKPSTTAPGNIQGVQEGKVNILGGYSISHSKQNSVCVHMVPMTFLLSNGISQALLYLETYIPCIPDIIIMAFISFLIFMVVIVQLWSSELALFWVEACRFMKCLSYKCHGHFPYNLCTSIQQEFPQPTYFSPEDGGNIGIYLDDYMVSQPRRPESGLFYCYCCLITNTLGNGPYALAASIALTL